MKTWWGLRTALPPASALCAALAAWFREQHPGWAWTFLALAVVAQCVLGLIQAAEWAESPTTLRKLSAAAAALFPTAVKIYRAAADSKASARAPAWDICLNALRSQIVAEEKQQDVRACFYQYDNVDNKLTLERSLNRGDDKYGPPGGFTQSDGAVFEKLTEVMRLQRPAYIRKRWYWKNPPLCDRLGAGVVAVGPALQRRANGDQVAVGLIIVDARSRRALSRHPTEGCVGAVACLIAAQPICEKADTV